MPAKILQLEVTEPIEPVWGMETCQELVILSRHRGRMIGSIWIPNPTRAPVIPAARIRAALLAEQNWLLGDLLVKDRVAPESVPAAQPPISVVIVSQGRPELLALALGAVGELEYPEAEVIVIDSSSGWRPVEELAARFPVRFVHEERPGLDAARNRGIAEARHDIVAFTVDHARPDRHWLMHLARGFADPRVSAVSGLVSAGELETISQYYAEFTFGLGLPLTRRTIDRSVTSPSEYLWARHLGSGTNLAVRRSRLGDEAWFAPGLDGASGREGAGDVELVYRLIATGHTLQYEPNALVWITHPRDEMECRRCLRAQARSYGVFLLEARRTGSVGLAAAMSLYLRGWLYERIVKRLLRPEGIPRRFIGAELTGTLASPIAYLVGRGARRAARRARHAARTGQRSRPTEGSPAVAAPVAVAPTDPGRPASGPDAKTIRVVRTWYPHWGRHSGMNQFLRFLDPERFAVVEQLVAEDEQSFPIRNVTARNWLRHRLQRNGMPWYSLSDFQGELATTGAFVGVNAPSVIHYLDGEHSAQFLPRLSMSRRRPRTVVTYHQPPDVLAKVIRPDVVRRMDRVSVVSNDQAEFVASLTSPDRVVVTPHGIDTDFFTPSPGAPRDRPFRCLSVGHNYRDYDVVRETAKQLRHAGVEFHVVSPRPTGMEDQPNARCYGRLSDEELRGLYRDCDVLLLPLTKVTANNAVLEAMACGLPVISTELPAMGLYVNPACAILVPTNETRWLAEAIDYLRQDEGVRRRMGGAARARAEELDWRHIAVMYEAIYGALR